MFAMLPSYPKNKKKTKFVCLPPITKKDLKIKIMNFNFNFNFSKAPPFSQKKERNSEPFELILTHLMGLKRKFTLFITIIGLD
jgi:hypothetical protein